MLKVLNQFNVKTKTSSRGRRAILGEQTDWEMSDTG